MNKKKNKMLEFWSDYLEADGQTLVDCALNDIEKLARTNVNEFKNLINLFNILKQKTIEEVSHKLFLAEILVKLDYEPVKDFLIKILESILPKTMVNSDTVHEHLSNQIDAAGLLIKLKDPRGKSFLEKIWKNMDLNNKLGIIEMLQYDLSLENLKLIVKIMHSDPETGNYIDMNYWEKLLKTRLEKDMP